MPLSFFPLSLLGTICSRLTAAAPPAHGSAAIVRSSYPTRAAARTVQTQSFRADLFPNSSQPAVLGQTRPQRFHRLAGLQGRQLQFAVQLLVADADVFLSGDAVQQKIGLHLGNGAVALRRRRRPKSSLRICSVFIPCAASARKPRSRRASICCCTSDSGTAKR